MRSIYLLLAVMLSVALVCVSARAEGSADPLMLLASASDPLPEDYVPDALRPIATTEAGVHLAITSTALLQEEALEPLYQMMRAAEKAGKTLYVRQAYRSYADEARRYEISLSLGQAAQRPGQSSYQTGLSVMLVGSDWKSGPLTEDFADSGESKWLREHAAEYGFVMRYPEGKEELTGWSYEPWHYRYVGVPLAKLMVERGLCLEEAAMGVDLSVPTDAPDELARADRVTEMEIVARDSSTFDPEIGPDGDYELSLSDLR